MSAHRIESTPSAYAYPLLIKQLLHTPLATSPELDGSSTGLRLLYAGYASFAVYGVGDAGRSTVEVVALPPMT